jgi:hypothetical protein
MLSIKKGRLVASGYTAGAAIMIFSASFMRLRFGMLGSCEILRSLFGESGALPRDMKIGMSSAKYSP